MANIVQVIIRGKDEASKAVKQADDALSGLGSTATKIVGGIAGVGLIMQQAFEFGREGAAISQTRESFDLLLDKVQASPLLFRQLQDAADGTITDLQLMASTSTLLAGAQGDLGTNLANATPELLKIARAAQKLNPTLGDTTFLYESLATGIKRASPLILDNLGLTVKVGDANKKFAEQLGKSVEELTAEEQKMALLNATLDAGSVLIDQVGGDVESATDDFDRLTVALEEIGQEMQESFVPRLADAAVGARNLVVGVGDVIDALAEQEQRLLRASVASGEWDTQIRRGADGAFHFATTAQKVERLVFEVGNEMENRGTPAAAGYAGALQTAAEAMGEVNDSIGFTVDSFSELSNKTLGREALDALNEYTDAQREHGDFNRQEYTSSLREIVDTFDLDLSPAMLNAMVRLQELKARFGEIESSSEFDAFLQGLQDINRELGIMSQWTGLSLNFDVGAGGGPGSGGVIPQGDAGAAGAGFAGDSPGAGGR